MSGITTDPNDPRLTRGVDKEPVPQAEVYLVLSEEERAKGFVRPLRHTYAHVGIRPRYPVCALTDEEQERYKDFGYVAFEAYPPEASPVRGRYWTRDEFNSGCGTQTTMSPPLAETYARKPDFYGATYCAGCRKHLPVSEFRWVVDGVVTDQQVGS